MHPAPLRDLFNRLHPLKARKVDRPPRGTSVRTRRRADQTGFPFDGLTTQPVNPSESRPLRTFSIGYTGYTFAAALSEQFPAVLRGEKRRKVGIRNPAQRCTHFELCDSFLVGH